MGRRLDDDRASLVTLSGPWCTLPFEVPRAGDHQWAGVGEHDPRREAKASAARADLPHLRRLGFEDCRSPISAPAALSHPGRTDSSPSVEALGRPSPPRIVASPPPQCMPPQCRFARIAAGHSAGRACALAESRVRVLVAGISRRPRHALTVRRDRLAAFCSTSTLSASCSNGVRRLRRPQQFGDAARARGALRIDPRTKTGLQRRTRPRRSDAPACDFPRRCRCRSLGTNLTNDVGLTPLQIVLKMVSCNGQPVAKLSDSPGKTMVDDEGYLRYLRQVFEVSGPAS